MACGSVIIQLDRFCYSAMCCSSLLDLECQDQFADMSRPLRSVVSGFKQQTSLSCTTYFLHQPSGQFKWTNLLEYSCLPWRNKCLRIPNRASIIRIGRRMVWKLFRIGTRLAAPVKVMIVVFNSVQGVPTATGAPKTGFSRGTWDFRTQFPRPSTGINLFERVNDTLSVISKDKAYSTIWRHNLRLSTTAS